MWTWPLDSAIWATTAHRASEGVADRTCTQVWAWMTNKCRKMMNQRKGYIIGEISHKGGAGEVRLGGNSYSRMRSPFPWGVGSSGSVLSSCLIIPNFYTSRCPIKAQLLDPLYKFIVLGLLGLDSRPLLGLTRKPWPYVYIYICWKSRSTNSLIGII